jgi:2-polyprenyl-3-methyl-5-hydroxy-6-metoxy-1,4-benzoquinol methylase
MLSFTHHGQRYTLKPGEAWKPQSSADTYRDTSARDLWAIVDEIKSGKPWSTAVAERYAKSNPWLQAIVTSPQRDLFFRQHPPAPGSKLLDIGSGWGQIALPLARTPGAHVVALEPTPERLAFIEAAARQDALAERMNFLQGDFLDVDFQTRFDLITCIGVLEWVPKFRSGDPRQIQIEFLRRARQCLAPDGQLVIGIENRLGLKYLLGAPDDHIGLPHIATYDAPLATAKYREKTGQELRSFTYTRAELDQLLREAGFSNVTFFAALPDYKLPQKILPLGSETEAYFACGPHIPEHDGTNGAPLVFQAELASHYRSLAALGIASDFCPSFFVVAV